MEDGSFSCLICDYFLADSLASALLELNPAIYPYAAEFALVLSTPMKPFLLLMFAVLQLVFSQTHINRIPCLYLFISNAQ